MDKNLHKMKFFKFYEKLAFRIFPIFCIKIKPVVRNLKINLKDFFKSYQNVKFVENFSDFFCMK